MQKAYSQRSWCLWGAATKDLQKAIMGRLNLRKSLNKIVLVRTGISMKTDIRNNQSQNLLKRN